MRATISARDRLAAFKFAFPFTLPVCMSMLVLGLSYGFLMGSKGFSFVYPMCMSTIMLAGSMEFLTVDLLVSAFDPVFAFLLALAVNARHVFYGISMLEQYKGMGIKRFYLIYGMCDESFAINSSTKVPEGIDRGWFMFFVTLLNHLYWIVGATAGGILGNVLTFDASGMEFVLTALYLAIVVGQWMETDKHAPALVGIVVSAVCLALIGPESFALPAMGGMLVVFYVMYRLDVPLALPAIFGGRRRSASEKEGGYR